MGGIYMIIRGAFSPPLDNWPCFVIIDRTRSWRSIPSQFLSWANIFRSTEILRIFKTFFETREKNLADHRLSSAAILKRETSTTRATNTVERNPVENRVGDKFEAKMWSSRRLERQDRTRRRALTGVDDGADRTIEPIDEGRWWIGGKRWRGRNRAWQTAAYICRGWARV